MNLEDLNPSQREAVLCIDAPSLVIAGAGSGKTRVLTYKIAYLLEQGMQPWNILALTFTNKAANEMRERIATLVSPEKAASLWMGTFHSIFAKILRQEGHRLGYDQNYTIYDTNDSLSLIKLIIKEMTLDEKVYKPSAVQNRISAAKNRLILPSGYTSVREYRESDAFYHRTLMPEIYNRYEERLKQANAMDFDDLLLNMWLICKHNPEVAAHWQERFHFVLVPHRPAAACLCRGRRCTEHLQFPGGGHRQHPPLSRELSRCSPLQARTQLPFHSNHRQCRW